MDHFVLKNESELIPAVPLEELNNFSPAPQLNSDRTPQKAETIPCPLMGDMSDLSPGTTFSQLPEHHLAADLVSTVKYSMPDDDADIDRASFLWPMSYPPPPP